MDKQQVEDFRKAVYKTLQEYMRLFKGGYSSFGNVTINPVAKTISFKPYHFPDDISSTYSIPMEYIYDRETMNRSIDAKLEEQRIQREEEARLREEVRQEQNDRSEKLKALTDLDEVKEYISLKDKQDASYNTGIYKFAEQQPYQSISFGNVRSCVQGWNETFE